MSEEEKWVSGKPVAVVLGVLLIGAALIKWWPSDTRAIRLQLDALADVISVPPAESDMSRAARLADLPSYFTPDAHVHLMEIDIPTRDALVALAERWTAPSGGVFVEFLDEQIAVGSDGTGRVELNARISRKDSGTGNTDVDERPASFEFVKVDGDWLITGVVSPASPRAR